ncbi:hypothetical protein ACMFMG_012103 [Clarireedia jacksonii]
MPEAEQTVDGGYEEIDYKVFGAVDYDRLMSWEARKAGSDEHKYSYVSIGENFEISKKFGTEQEEENKLLPKGWFVMVMNKKFKLVAATP